MYKCLIFLLIIMLCISSVSIAQANILSGEVTTEFCFDKLQFDGYASLYLTYKSIRTEVFWNYLTQNRFQNPIDHYSLSLELGYDEDHTIYVRNIRFDNTEDVRPVIGYRYFF